MMGYEESEELLGKHYLELIREDVRAKAEQFYREQLLARIPSTYYEFPAMTKGGEEVWFGQHVRLRLVEGRMIGVEAIARDITARKVAEQALRERAKCAAFAAEVSLILNHDSRSTVCCSVARMRRWSISGRPSRVCGCSSQVISAPTATRRPGVVTGPFASICTPAPASRPI